ncbi:hypothetical protein NGM37_24895, partial [Streptomyces sp. TRM76130]|nr:hypothetical protein [Streptomyces sp. TRM76130]
MHVGSAGRHSLYGTAVAKRTAGFRPAAHLPTLSALTPLVASVPLPPWTLQDTAPTRDGAALAPIAWPDVANRRRVPLHPARALTGDRRRPRTPLPSS